ncbi:hypothetical protein A8990_110147 [Paenibacillus taihuensis]|uniref:Uncharacterized protein n=1 Tax=Paenibacillus taihuensis TaxID=1156355 RepID=A0A3D9S1Q4_9BACL|nr:hypothetical protein [Paenibacillus taihuensis]REE86537.1 hypothetical protein A8990_110147 [Paenibacillus taihuensis]
MNEVNERVKLSQWDALLMESLRVLGWSDDEIIQKTMQGELPKEDTSIYEFNYEELTAFATREPETFEAAVRTGYQIKYNTIRGIRSWINVAFKLEPELVLDAGNEAVVAELTPAQQERVASVLSHGWVIQGEHAGAAEEASRYVIVPQA